jgi:ribonuclease T2
MRSIAAILAVACIAGASAANIRGARRTSGSCTDSKSFDYIILEQQWPPTQCKDQFQCSNPPLFFTMHGAWPNDDNGDYPCNCSDEQFDPSAVSNILSELETYWPSLKCTGSDDSCDDSFWSHEWGKHGTCAGYEISSMQSQEGYFGTTLELRSKYDLLTALKAANIEPSDSEGYSADDVKAAVKNYYGATPNLQCDDNGNISVMAVCFSTDLMIQDCMSDGDACYKDTVYLPVSA